MFINRSNSDDEKETIILLPDNERENERKNRLMSIIIFCQFSFPPFSLLLYVSLSFFNRQAKKRKKKSEWSLHVLKLVDALSAIEQVNNDSLNFSCRSNERTSILKRDRENLADKVVKVNSPSTTDTTNMNPQEIRINYIFFLFLPLHL
jgi:hypothetical protein